MKKEVLVFATGNSHKLREVNMMLAETRFVAKAMSEFGVTEDITEDGDTMHANAKLKSDYLQEKLNISSFGEDSGLEVTCLDMRPGIYTARYAGPQRNDQDNMSKVLDEMKGVKAREAQFRSVIALNIEGKTYHFEGIVHGSISTEKRGDRGFGYDPIFIPKEYEQTFAELGDDVKNQFSHRAKSVKKMVDFLKELD